MSDLPKDWSKWTIAELKDELKEKGLSTAGVKSQLVSRLDEYGKEANASEEMTTKETEVIDKDLEAEMDEERESQQTGNGAEYIELDTTGQGTDVNQEEEYDGVKHRNYGEDVQVGTETATTDMDEEGEDKNQKEDRNKADCQGWDTEGQDEGQKQEIDGEEDSFELEVRNEDLEDELETCDDLKGTQEHVSLDGEDNEEDMEEQHEGEGDQNEAEDVIIILDDDDEEDIEVVSEKEKEQMAGGSCVEQKEMKSASEEKSQKPAFKAAVNPQNKPMGFFHFKNWIGHQFHIRSRERTLLVNPVTSKDKLCSLLRDWTPKCSEFQLLYGRDGNGAALMRFVTMETMNKAKAAISELVGAEFVLQMTDLFRLESSVKKAVDVSFRAPDLASRSIAVKGIPKITREDRILHYFPDAMLMTRPVKKREFKVELPPEVESHCFIEFPSAESAQAAVKNGQNITETFDKAVVMSMVQYLEEFKKWEKERSRIISSERDYESQMISDEDRIQMCQEFQRVDSQLSRMRKKGSQGNKTLMEEVKNTRTRLLRSIDEDTDLRRMLGKTLPEPDKLMTAYGKGVMRSMLQENIQTEKMDISEVGEESMMTNMDDLPEMGAIQHTMDSEDKYKLLTEIRKLQPDESGHFTLSVKNDGKFSEKIEILQHFSHFGDIIDTRITKRRGFVTFEKKEEAVRMLMDLFGNKELSVAVPTKSQNQANQKEGDSKVPGNVFYQMFVGGGNQDNKQQQQQNKMLGDIPVKVNVSNINKETKAAKLRLFLSRFGPVLSIELEEPSPNKTSLTAAVTFKDAQSAFKALAAHNVVLDGCPLVLMSGASVGREQYTAVVQDAETLRDRQVCVRELNLNTKEKSVRRYFAQFGEIEKCHLFLDGIGRSKGFGLVTFRDERSAEETLKFQNKTNHVVDRKVVLVAPQKGSKYKEDIAERTPAPSLMSINTQKTDTDTKEPTKEKSSATVTEGEEEEGVCDRQVFLYELNLESTKDSLEKYFSGYGDIEKCHLFCSKTGRSRGFAQITYRDEDSVKLVLTQQLKRNHIVDRKRIRVAAQKGSKYDTEDKAAEKASSQKSEEAKTLQKPPPSISAQITSGKADNQPHKRKSRFGPFAEVPQTNPQVPVQTVSFGHSVSNRGQNMPISQQLLPSAVALSGTNPVQSTAGITRRRRFDVPPVLPQTSPLTTTGDRRQSAVMGPPQPRPGLPEQPLLPPSGLSLNMYQGVLDHPTGLSDPRIQPVMDTHMDVVSTNQVNILSEAMPSTGFEEDLGSPHRKQRRLEEDIPQGDLSNRQRGHGQDRETSQKKVASMLKSLHEAISEKMEDLSKMGATKTNLTSALKDAVLQGFSRSGSASQTQQEPRAEQSRLASRTTVEEPQGQVDLYDEHRRLTSGTSEEEEARRWREPYGNQGRRSSEFAADGERELAETYDSHRRFTSRSPREEPRKVKAYDNPKRFGSRATVEDHRRVETYGDRRRVEARTSVEEGRRLSETYDRKRRLESRITVEEYPRRVETFDNQRRHASRMAPEEHRRLEVYDYSRPAYRNTAGEYHRPEERFDDHSQHLSRSDVEDYGKAAQAHHDQRRLESRRAEPHRVTDLYSDRSRHGERSTLENPQRPEKHVGKEFVDLLHQQEVLRKEMDKQQEVLRNQEIQLLQQQQEELLLQRQLIQLQQMKEAALREAMAEQYGFRK